MLSIISFIQKVSIMVRVLIHHGGKFRWGEEYTGETFDMGTCDVDYLSTLELSHSVKSLGYLQVGSMWWSLDDDPVTEVKPLLGDEDIITMQNQVYKERSNILHVWVEHAVDQPCFAEPDVELHVGEVDVGREGNLGDGAETEEVIWVME
ncbi:hypothetical protein CJ030_MR3G009548 [Morella rubra]|uniref:PB1-like domain-containing protein n=1 Tax=Morella rubra TaxID=262757 RepID=A0A6A1W6G1_9ROSI|nr:hypothetical protein CJ030_MR3G009548 [Morella rubra]